LVTLDEVLVFYDYFGYAGILLMSFIISILFFLPIPYFPLPLIASFNENFNPHLISLSGATGAVAAKMIIFYLAYSGYNIIARKSKGRTMSLQKLLARYGWIGALVATVTPFTGNIIYITLGLTRYSPWKFAVAVFAGEFLYNEFIVWIGVLLGRPFAICPTRYFRIYKYGQSNVYHNGYSSQYYRNYHNVILVSKSKLE
jgi:membrane protein DedA with SNARE-associated domain